VPDECVRLGERASHSRDGPRTIICSSWARSPLAGSNRWSLGGEAESWTGPTLHIAGMGSSYILMPTAFYVRQCKNLPLWRDLPPIAYGGCRSLSGVQS